MQTLMVGMLALLMAAASVGLWQEALFSAEAAVYAYKAQRDMKILEGALVYGCKRYKASSDPDDMLCAPQVVVVPWDHRSVTLRYTRLAAGVVQIMASLSKGSSLTWQVALRQDCSVQDVAGSSGARGP